MIEIEIFTTRAVDLDLGMVVLGEKWGHPEWRRIKSLHRDKDGFTQVGYEGSGGFPDQWWGPLAPVQVQREV